MPVVVVTDSAAGLSPEQLQRWRIRVVGLHILVDGVDYGGAAIDYSSAVVTTSAPPPAEIADVYRQALVDSAGDGVVAVHLSAKLSATHGAAVLAAADCPGPVTVVDSLGAGLATGYAALAAARAAAAGAPAAAVHRIAENISLRTKSFVIVDRLEQLRRGGRISTAAAFFGTALVSKPVLRLSGGKLELMEKARTRSTAYTKLAAAAVRAAGAGPASVAVQHLDAAERAGELAARLAEQIPGAAEVPVERFGPVLGVHLGTGAVGVVVVPGGLATDVPSTAV